LEEAIAGTSPGAFRSTDDDGWRSPVVVRTAFCVRIIVRGPPRHSLRVVTVALEALSADLFTAGIIRQGYHPMEEVKQLPSADVLHLMFVFIRAATERAVVVPEPYGSFCVGMLHGVSNMGYGQLLPRPGVQCLRMELDGRTEVSQSAHRCLDIASGPITDAPRRRWGWY